MKRPAEWKCCAWWVKLADREDHVEVVTREFHEWTVAELVHRLDEWSAREALPR